MNALDRMSGGPDDNSAQANHLVATPLTCPSLVRSWGNNAGHPGHNGMNDAILALGEALAAGVRRLTPRECERLQGFPDDWTLIPGQKCPDSRRYAAMGNAVTVNVAEWIGRRIVAIDSTTGAAAPSRTQAEETTCPRSPTLASQTRAPGQQSP